MKKLEIVQEIEKLQIQIAKERNDPKHIPMTDFQKADFIGKHNKERLETMLKNNKSLLENIKYAKLKAVHEAEFWNSPEGSLFKKNKEGVRSKLEQFLKDEHNSAIANINHFLSEKEATANFKIEQLHENYFTLSWYNDGKVLFGSDIPFTYKRDREGKIDEPWTANVGTTGVFEICGDRSQFYQDLGMFLGAQFKNTRFKIFETVLTYSRNVRGIWDELNKVETELKNPLGL